HKPDAPAKAGAVIGIQAWRASEGRGLRLDTSLTRERRTTSSFARASGLNSKKARPVLRWRVRLVPPKHARPFSNLLWSGLRTRPRPPTAGLPWLRETCGRAGWPGRETRPQHVRPTAPLQ